MTVTQISCVPSHVYKSGADGPFGMIFHIFQKSSLLYRYLHLMCDYVHQVQNSDQAVTLIALLEKLSTFLVYCILLFVILVAQTVA